MESQDYSRWSNEQLIARVIELERQLSTQTSLIKQEQASSNPLRPRKSRPERTFDPSKYSSRLIALKFAYLGQRYNGFEHHANNSTPLPTIEEELWKALMKARLIFPADTEAAESGQVKFEGCEYSKCGRTDRGVSAFGQVIGIRVRSNRPLIRNGGDNDSDIDGEPPPTFDPVKDELPYAQILNRLLPEDIRILAWCLNPPAEFSARFSGKERRYRYFFTQPAYAPTPGPQGFSRAEGPNPRRDGWLDIEAMREAAKHYIGLHDFRNFCKIDPSKQITNFERRIFHADIEEVKAKEGPVSFVGRPEFYEFARTTPHRSLAPREAWTAEELETLWRGIQDGQTARQMVKLRTRRTVDAINRRKQLLLSAREPSTSLADGTDAMPALLRWTPDEDKRLLQGRREGKGWAEISTDLGGRRSSQACRYRWYDYTQYLQDEEAQTEKSESKQDLRGSLSSSDEEREAYARSEFKQWSPEDKEVLSREWEAGKSPGEVQRELFPSRTVRAVKEQFSKIRAGRSTPKVYSFTIHGSAFLWHQVRHLVAILFLVGQGLESPSIVPKLLDIKETPSKPMYEMATDAPLVLWDCIFPDNKSPSREDSLEWIYVGDQAGKENNKRKNEASKKGKYGPGGLVDGLWSVWRKRKMDELLAGMLVDVAVGPEDVGEAASEHAISDQPMSAKVFDGGDTYRLKGQYIPVLQRERLESPEVINARYAARKGLKSQATAEQDQAEE